MLLVVCFRGGFFKKVKSPSREKKSTSPKEKTPDPSIEEENLQLVKDKSQNQTSPRSERRATTIAAVGPGTAFGTQLAAELKQKGVVQKEDSETSLPVSGKDNEEKQKPKPKPRSGRSPTIPQQMLNEMKGRQESKKVLILLRSVIYNWLFITVL